MKKLLPAQPKSLLESRQEAGKLEKAKGKIKLWPILISIFFSFFTVYFPKPALAQCLNDTFNFRVADQNGSPLQGAFVPVYWKGKLFTYCSTNSLGQCYVCLSCATPATPCDLSGEVEYQGYKGSYQGAYPDGAVIEVIINIPAPSPSPSPPSPSPSPAPPSGQACGLSSGAQDSRPDRCPIPICNITDKLTASCATAFSAVDSISFQRRDGTLCEGDYWVEDTWGGTVEINLSETTVPFVGKKGAEDRQKYLADYFEGICPYYTGKLCPRPENPEEIWTGQAETGVWQWLAPQETQDELKEKMVERAIKSKQGLEPEPIHDYLVTDGIRQRYLSQFKGHFPPKPEDYSNYEAWLTAKNAWEKTEWGKLWPYVPMFSREDTQGWVFPYAGLRPGLPPEKEHFYVEPKETKVPHLARLYEVTKAIQELLLSWGWIGQETQAQKNSPTLLTSNEKALGEKTLLAQGPGCVPCGCKYYYGDSLGDCSCMGRIKPDGEPECRGEHAGGNGCPIKKHWHEYGTLCGWTDCQPEQRGCSPGQVCCGESVGPSPGPPPAPIPACGLRPPAPVNLCQKPAIMDPNPNDDICCGSIFGDLVATDQVINDKHIECSDYTCGPTGTSLCPDDPCLDRVTKQVSRQIGINLLHPYLSEIWDQVAALPDGLFNFFRPNIQTEFSDIDAASRVTYGYVPGSAEPSVGQFYYPYLGGVQKAKEWVVNFMLNPSAQVAF